MLQKKKFSEFYIIYICIICISFFIGKNWDRNKIKKNEDDAARLKNLKRIRINAERYLVMIILAAVSTMNLVAAAVLAIKQV